MIHQDARHAIQEGQAKAPSVIGYRQGRGWLVYCPTQPPPDCIPEILCIRLGVIPIPLTDEGVQVLTSALNTGGEQ
jgi:hypothetical protein